jgi:hypothetical protein
MLMMSAHLVHKGCSGAGVGLQSDAYVCEEDVVVCVAIKERDGLDGPGIAVPQDLTLQLKGQCIHNLLPVVAMHLQQAT